MRKFKSYEQLQRSILFYRIVSVLLVAMIAFIGLNNIKTTEAADGYKEQLKAEKIKSETIRQEFNDALCLPRIAKFDKELGLKA